MKQRLAPIAARLEDWIAQAFPRPREPKVIAPYIGYATPTQLIVRGRVLASDRRDIAVDGQSRWLNLRQILRLFLTDEVADVDVTAAGVTARTDEEGYFTLLLPREGQAGRIDVTVSAGSASAVCPVQVADASARQIIISDIDDTMMATGAWSLWRNLWTSLTGNALTRHVFPDAVALMRHLTNDGRNPVFYVSSSPWNFHDFLQTVFARAGLPRAPMFLRDYGFSETQFITGTHGNHKGAAIDTIIGAYPDLPVVLIGDTGQHDPAIYAAVARRHPGRVTHAIFRSAGGIGPEDRLELDHLKDMGATVHVGDTYDKAIAAFRSLA